MIDERREEQACSYILGALSSEESFQLEVAAAEDNQLRQLVQDLHSISAAIAMQLALHMRRTCAPHPRSRLRQALARLGPGVVLERAAIAGGTVGSLLGHRPGG